MEASVTDREGTEPERRSVEEREARVDEIRARQSEIEADYQGLPLPDDVRSEMEDLENEKREEERVIEELRAREAIIAENGALSERTERPAAPQVRRPGVATDEDLHDVSSARFASDPHGELRDRAKRIVERMQFPQLGKEWRQDVTREDVQAHIDGLIERHESDPDSPNAGKLARRIMITSDPAYRRAWMKAAIQRPVSAEEQRKLSLTGAEGGFAVPTTLDPTIIPTSNSVVNPTRALARIETIMGSNTWNGVSSGAITASRVAEEAAATDNAPTLAQPTATVSKAHAFVPFSDEIGEDWGALEQEIGRLLQDAKDDEEGASFVTGAGSATVPQGFVTGTTNTVAAATGLTVTAANLYALEAALPPRFRRNHTFVANRGIYNVVRGIDTSGGAALWLYVSQGLTTQAPSPGNTGAQLLGRPAYEASAMQATVVNATKIMIVGDFSYFLIVDRIGMSVQLIPFLFGAAQGNLPTGRKGIYAHWRNYSKVLSASAFVALTGTT